jgi:hypothetical protein
MTRNAPRAAIALVAVLALAASPARATPPAYAGVQARYWSFRTGSDLRDALVYWVPGPLHVQLEWWDFVDPGTRDQFRPEVGLHVRDARRSVYTVQWRHERDDERLWFETEQTVGAHAVTRAGASPIVGRDSTAWVYDAGLDWYWGSYHFAQATVVRDPRAGGLWVVPLRVRLATERDDWLQFTLAPASRRTLGWAVDGKWHGVRAGIERNSRYDFTSDDNIVFTVGFEQPLTRAR